MCRACSRLTHESFDSPRCGTPDAERINPRSPPVEERMERFGEALRNERESRGVTLDQICATTKVSLRHLESLEADDFEHLPSGVFRKGIVRSYVQAVGLDEPMWVERFDASLRRSGISSEIDSEGLTQFAHAVKRSRPGAPRSMSLRWLGVLALLLALAGATFALWKYVLVTRIHL